MSTRGWGYNLLASPNVPHRGKGEREKTSQIETVSNIARARSNAPRTITNHVQLTRDTVTSKYSEPVAGAAFMFPLCGRIDICFMRARSCLCTYARERIHTSTRTICCVHRFQYPIRLGYARTANARNRLAIHCGRAGMRKSNTSIALNTGRFGYHGIQLFLFAIQRWKKILRKSYKCTL